MDTVFSSSFSINSLQNSQNSFTQSRNNHDIQYDEEPKPHMKIPKRIILVRHGESLGNFDESVYCTVPDWKVPLTETGKKQSIEAGNIPSVDTDYLLITLFSLVLF